MIASLPYLLPVLDALPYAKFMLVSTRTGAALLRDGLAHILFPPPTALSIPSGGCSDNCCIRPECKLLAECI